MIVIPAIDIRGGRCVRLIQGDAQRERVYADDPVQVAREWTLQGARWLHVVDLDGAFAGRPVHLDLLRAITASTDVPVQAGGGFRTLEDIEAGLDAGAARVVLGTAALGLAEEANRRFGERVAAAVDVKDGRVAAEGWVTFQDSDPATWGRALAARGIRRFIYTDIARDGMLAGPDVAGVAAFIAAMGVPVIASGGVASPEDVRNLERVGVEGVIVGRALYEGGIDLKEASTGMILDGAEPC